MQSLAGMMHMADLEMRRALLIAQRGIIDASVRRDTERRRDGVALKRPQWMRRPDANKTSKLPAALAQDQAGVAGGRVGPRYSVGLVPPRPIAMRPALGDVEDLLGVDFVITEAQALRQRKRNGLRLGWHQAAAFAAGAAARWSCGFRNYRFPSDVEKPQGPGWTCGGVAPSCGSRLDLRVM